MTVGLMNRNIQIEEAYYQTADGEYELTCGFRVDKWDDRINCLALCVDENLKGNIGKVVLTVS